ncbi:hypothetical protein [Microvirga sp. G4-2]|uniref:hypothetical protein n=1 Tax=Microvirga sp. G4-2 TaxID=3434467 RepID=UPI0040449232
MRKFLAAVGRAIAEATRVAWQLVVIAGKLAWALVPKPPAIQPPVSAAEALADEIVAEHLEDKSAISGVTHRSPLGVAAAHYARDPAMDVSALPEDIQVWLATLTDGERAKLATLMPHQIERHVRAGSAADRIRDLPPVMPLRVAQARAAEASAVRGLKRRKDPDDQPEREPAFAI